MTGSRLLVAQRRMYVAGRQRGDGHAQNGFFCHCGRVCSMELRHGGRSRELWAAA